MIHIKPNSLVKSERKAPKIKPPSLAPTGSIFVALFRGLKLGFSNFWRNKFLSLATIVVMAVIIFIFNIILTVQHISNQALQTLSERVDIVVYLKDDISFYEAKGLTESLRNVEGVKQVKYTSKEEALEIVAKVHPKTAEFLKKFNLKNPLPPSISIISTNPDDHSKIQALLEQDQYKALTKTYLPQGSMGDSQILSAVTQNLNNISNFVRQTVFWMVLVFILGGTLVVVNAIQLTIYTRRQEITIMRLVGATPGFIRLPFIFEGILYGICAVILSFIIFIALSQTIQIQDSNLWAYYSNVQFGRIFLAELLISIALAIISSFSATEQYLQGKLTNS